MKLIFTQQEFDRRISEARRLGEQRGYEQVRDVLYAILNKQPVFYSTDEKFLEMSNKLLHELKLQQSEVEK